LSIRRFFLFLVTVALFLTPASAGPALLDLESETTAHSAAPIQQGIKVLQTAQSFLGTPYVWGGVTKRGFDCSGYVQAVLKAHGFMVPRLADVQYAHSQKVKYDQLKPGDMVFFSTYLPGASHCGFYLGNGEFIHASSAGKRVMISQMRTGYYRQRFVGGGRPPGWLASNQR
jgi:cell wall-associated NlpC family hydrolase